MPAPIRGRAAKVGSTPSMSEIEIDECPTAVAAGPALEFGYVSASASTSRDLPIPETMQSSLVLLRKTLYDLSRGQDLFDIRGPLSRAPNVFPCRGL